MRALELGTKVRVKENLVEEGIYKHHTGSTNSFIDTMEQYKGKIFKIIKDTDHGYILDSSIPYQYTDEMLEVVRYPNGLKYREGDYLLNLETLDLLKVVKAVNDKIEHNYALEYVNPDTDVNTPNPLVNGEYLWCSSLIENERYYKLVPEPVYKVGQKIILENEGSYKNGEVVAIHYNGAYEKYDYSIDCFDGNSYYVYAMHDYKIKPSVIDIIPSKFSAMDIRKLYPSTIIKTNVVDDLNAKLDEYQKELDEIYKKQSDLLVEERKLLDRENEINKILSAIQTTIDEFQEQ